MWEKGTIPVGDLPKQLVETLTKSTIRYSTFVAFSFYLVKKLYLKVFYVNITKIPQAVTTKTGECLTCNLIIIYQLDTKLTTREVALVIHLLIDLTSS